MSVKELKYNIFREKIFYIKDEFKKKGNEFGILNLNKKQINSLTEAIDLMSVAPVSSKFSERIEKFLFPRFEEINEMLYKEKALPNDLGIEISKENHKDIIPALAFQNVKVGLRDRGYSIEELNAGFRKVKFFKFKP
ncbi:MAG: hypothetical protein ACFE85_08395 [Candidatus Hodarchaeota archaeon]